MDQCNALCALPKFKCNVSDHKCYSCDEAKDSNCSMTSGDCQNKCPNMKSYFKCNTTSKTCEQCKNSTDPLCMLADKQTCDKGCKQPTPPPTDQKYYCNWANNTCMVAGKDSPDPQPKEKCEEICKKPVYAKCNLTSQKCEECTQGPADPTCTNTMDWCQAAASAGYCKPKKPTDLKGVWRGIEISQGFKRGEWDISFSDDASSMVLQYFDTKVEQKWHAKVEVSTVPNLEAGVAALTLTFTEAPPAGNLLGVSTGTKAVALFQVADGYQRLFKVMNFAVAKAGAKPNSFDTAMTEGNEFVLVGCMHADNCDFTKATPALFEKATRLRLAENLFV